MLEYIIFVIYSIYFQEDEKGSFDEIKIYEENDEYLIDRYTITEEQLRYTMSPKASIELVKQDKDRHAVLVFDEDKLVTFFVLHENDGVKPYSSNEQSILIRAFSTDFYEQGKGYAKTATAFAGLCFGAFSEY
ncbi:hypothetical protein [Lysinibacillus xylanilyticus]|uniref:hypothetical protein n=1 Tax=Lysinibacillus xylanilyticus TaxID=582475 RepID=UPI003D07DF92